MNAAARLVNHEGVVSRGWIVSVFFSQFHLMLFLFICAILTSSLGSVYVTNTTRSMHASLQQTFVERDRLHIQWGQLLLEKSTLLMQSRIQNIAEQRLAMIFPEGKMMVMIDG